MKKVLVMVGLLFAVGAYADSIDDAPTTTDLFSCKVKVFDGKKKVGVEFNGVHIDDEKDILKVKKLHSVKVGETIVHFTGGVASDDECPSGERCRVVLRMHVDHGPASVAYANGEMRKVGVMNEFAKLSCTVQQQ